MHSFSALYSFKLLFEGSNLVLRSRLDLLKGRLSVLTLEAGESIMLVARLGFVCACVFL